VNIQNKNEVDTPASASFMSENY